METWEICILKSVVSLGGEAFSNRIYERVSQFRTLTERHTAESKWQGRPNYVHGMRSHFTSLCNKKELERIAPGHFRITDKGRRRLFTTS